MDEILSARRQPLNPLGAALLWLWVASGYWTVAPMSITSALAAAFIVLGVVRHRAGAWNRSPADLGAATWAIALGISAVFAVDPTASFARLGKAAFPFLVGVGAGLGRDASPGRRAIAVLLVSCSLASAFGLVQFVLRGASFASRARGPVGHYLTFAGQLAIGLSLAIAILLVVRDRRWRIAAGVTAALAFVTLLATFTRSSWLGVLAGTAVMLALVRPWALLPLGAGVALFVGFAPGALRDRLWSMFDLRSPWNEQRTYMWEAGLRMFRDHPITGVGLQDLQRLYEQYRPPAATEGAGHLHSVPVHVAATMGAIGLVALVVLLVSLARTAAHRLRARLRAGDLAGAVALGATGAIVAFAVAGLFEWNLGDEEVLHPLYALIGLAWASRSWTRPAPGAEPARA